MRDSFLKKELIRVRGQQLIINNLINKKKFKIPIHLALGHEALSVAIAQNFSINDKLLLTHRNIHYHLSLSKTLNSSIEAYELKRKGLESGKYGSMNLINKKKGIIYTSSILGNNLPVSLGVAYAQKNKKNVVFVVTGDGAIEEGSFWESCVLAKSLNLKLIFAVENNDWSMYSSIKDRRSKIDLKKFADSIGLKYLYLESNDVVDYFKKLKSYKQFIKENSVPGIVEVKLHTLGFKTIQRENKKKFINYHHGGIKDLKFYDNIILSKSKKDPIFVMKSS